MKLETFEYTGDWMFCDHECITGTVGTGGEVVEEAEHIEIIELTYAKSKARIEEIADLLNPDLSLVAISIKNDSGRTAQWALGLRLSFSLEYKRRATL